VYLNIQDIYNRYNYQNSCLKASKKAFLSGNRQKGFIVCLKLKQINGYAPKDFV